MRAAMRLRNAIKTCAERVRTAAARGADAAGSPVLFEFPSLVGCGVGALALAVAVTSAGCGGASAARGGLRIVATTGMIGDMAGRIAGSHAKVESLMGPGVDPHLFKPSESDVTRLSDADLILYNGLHLEGKMGDILVKMARQKRVVAVSESISQNRLREPPEFAGQYDPHIWFDVSLWLLTLEPIERELAALDPAHAAEYKQNATALRQELEALDRSVEEQIASIPKAQRILITAHDAFGYFGRRYHMDVMGLQGISTVAEASLKDVERVVHAIVERKIKAIFVESSVPRRTLEAVQAACQAQGWKVAIGGQLFSDAMGAAGTPEGTYAGMVSYNVRTIVGALR